MSELRKDSLLNRWVIVSSERGERPSSFGHKQARQSGSKCPFCMGNEDATPKEILAFREQDSKPNKAGWSLRVIPNKFPALLSKGELSAQSTGLREKMNGIGVHEVIIETPKHNHDVADMSISEISDIFISYRKRINSLQSDNRIKQIVIFKNHGDAAGASLEHSHSQLIGTPVIPKRISEELEGAKNYFDVNKQCLFCDMIMQELADRDRIIAEYDNFISFAPFASRMPFECCIIPKSHQSGFAELDDSDYPKLAECLRDLLQRLNSALDNPPFNYIIHTRPTSSESDKYYHWHIEVIPQLINVGGFEWGAEIYINSTSPETATQHLRNTELQKKKRIFKVK